MKKLLGIFVDVVSAIALVRIFVLYVPDGSLGVGYGGGVLSAILAFFVLLTNKITLSVMVVGILAILIARAGLKQRGSVGYFGRSLIGLGIVVATGTICMAIRQYLGIVE